MREGCAVRAYIRVSTEEQALSGFSLRAQEDQLKAIAAAYGWQIKQLYRDDGYSAKDMHRPGLQALLRDAEAGDVVLVYKLDRLTRSVRDLDDLLREFDRRGLAFRSATEQFETATASGRLFLRIVTEIAQWERETIAERTAMGKRKKVEMGEWPGGPAPFGYRAVPSDRVKAGKRLLMLEPDPHRAHLVSAIFERYLNGHGMRAVCLWLNDELGARTTGGARWRVSTLARLLTNPIYCGDLVHGRRTRGEVTRVQGSHQPLVPRERFEQVQRLFQLRKGMAPRQTTGQYPLAGIARCALCGGPVDTCLRRGKRSYLYRCRNYVNGVGCGDGVQKPLSGVAGAAAEERLLDLVAGLPIPGRLSEACDLLAGAADTAGLAEQERLRADLAEAESAVRRWSRGYETGGIAWDEYLAHTRPHVERISIMREQLARQWQEPVRPVMAEPALSTPDIRAAWHHLAPPERKLLLHRFVRAFGVTVLLHPQGAVSLGPLASAASRYR